MKSNVIFLLFTLCLFIPEYSPANEQQGHINIKVDLQTTESPQAAKIWLPYPVSGQYQLIEDMHIQGNFINSGVYKEPISGVLYFYAEWPKGIQQKRLLFGFNPSSSLLSF
ncbi:hypothetical protein [Bathymodiolus japonicus methanotrophic gill symbiont]|uniref:hypothetical protein n=1 Tax=Bathymodiolus japonicus methanotrophic gill symbiont TaxID=113269 RepID=UPI001C8D6B3F|nr:hypothetical protein [Bathymodiolus japonicus methanotrophic gill symbiont]